VVNNAICQGRLWSNNSKVNSIFPGYFSQSLYISRANIKIMGNLSSASIARSDVNFLDFEALG